MPFVSFRSPVLALGANADDAASALPQIAVGEEGEWVSAPVDRFIRGAQRLNVREDGLVQPLRFSAVQSHVYEQAGRSDRAVSTAGVVIDFITTGDEVALDIEVTRPLNPDSRDYRLVMAQQGNLGDAVDGLVDGIDVRVGSHINTVPAVGGTLHFDYDNPSQEPVEITIYLPSIMSVAVGNLRSNGPISKAPKRGYLLALGDSIVQGYIVGCPSRSWPAIVAQSLGLDLVNQAVSGHVFDAATLGGTYHLRRHLPRAIVVGYGTNDWAHGTSALAIETAAHDYLTKLARTFPGVPVYVLSPVWRADAKQAKPCGKKFGWMRKMLSRQCAELTGFHMIDGLESMPHETRFLADGHLHPNSIGSEIIADAVLDAMGVEDDTQALDAARAAAIADQITARMPGAPAGHPNMDAAIRTIWRLRQPDGCPWDSTQTHASISRNMIEEAYEAVDAIERGDAQDLAEELGDVLMQVLLHAQIAADEGSFTIDDIAGELHTKLVRRHPHVYGARGAADDADEVLDIWEDVKRDEREGAPAHKGLLDSVPRSFPALMQCQKISKRAAKAGFEWTSTAEVWEKVAEERAEFEAEPKGSAEATEEFGDLLFALVNVARWEGIDAEGALRAANEKFRRRWADMEARALEEGTSVEDIDTARLEELWTLAKREGL